MESGTPKPNISLTPKQRFQLDTESARHHQQMVHLDQFQASADSAMLEYAQQLATAKDEIGEHLHWKLAGATEFLDTFKRLAETPVVPKRKDLDNL